MGVALSLWLMQKIMMQTPIYPGSTSKSACVHVDKHAINILIQRTKKSRKINVWSRRKQYRARQASETDGQSLQLLRLQIGRLDYNIGEIIKADLEVVCGDSCFQGGLDFRDNQAQRLSTLVPLESDGALASWPCWIIHLL